MIDLAWDEDIFLDESGDLDVVEEGAQVASHVIARLKTILGENYYNTGIGLPWGEGMYTPLTTYDQKAAMIRSTILKTPGVTDLISFSFGVDTENRIMSVEFRIKTEYNTEETGDILV